MRHFRYAALSAAVALSACSGGGSTSEFDPGQFNQYSNDLFNMANDPFRQNPTSSFGMPASGTATYTGVGVFGADLSPSRRVVAAGRAVIDVNFQNGGFDGTIDRLVRDNDEVLTGSLRVSDGGVRFPRSQTVPAVANGTIEADGQSVNIRTSGTGQYFGPSGETVLYDLDGSSNTGTYSGDAVVLIVAEQ